MSSPSSADGRIGVAVLGSTGSIGRQALDVLGRHPDRFRVAGLAAGSDAAGLADQAARFRPSRVALASDAPIDLPPETERLGGEDGLEALATADDVALVVVATGGIVSLRPILAALRSGRVVATANKETLVSGGHLVMPLARALAHEASAGQVAGPLAGLRPIDSEHSAIWQCLAGEPAAAIDRLILTASGGPFREASPEAIAAASPEEALRHPTWRMGAKITIDSATLVNKGLEVIEAHWLYDVGDDAIDVVIHPQSVVHSAVRFVDGSIKAQLGTPDMRLPIQYALTYPERQPSPAGSPDLVAAGRLEFHAPDEGRFPALRIARDAGRIGSRASAAVIAADEVAVARFLAGELDLPGIARTLESAVERFGQGPDQMPDLATLEALDAEVRAAFAGAAGRTV